MNPRCLYCRERIPEDVAAAARFRCREPLFCKRRHKDLYHQRKRRLRAHGLEGAELEKALCEPLRRRYPPKIESEAEPEREPQPRTVLDVLKAQEAAKRPKPAETPKTEAIAVATRPLPAVEPTQSPPAQAIDALPRPTAEAENVRASVLAELDALLSTHD